MFHEPGILRSVDGDVNRPFWNMTAQTLAPADITARARDGLAAEWSRIWSLPVAYYRDKCAAAGLDGSVVPPLDDIPRTTKNDLRANEAQFPPFGTHRTVSLAEAVRIGGTTGTSGRLVYIMFGPRDLAAMIEGGARATWRYGLRPGDRISHSWPGGFYISSTSTGLFYVKAGMLEIPVGPPATPEVAQEHLRLWKELRPDGFMISGSQLNIYEAAAESLGMDLAEIFEGTKVGLFDLLYQFDSPRKMAEARYGMHIRNLGGAGEVPGFGNSDCDFRTGLHFPQDSVIVQVCDPVTGRQLPDGERGHLVITTFGLDCCFIRYDVEDIATMSHEPCPCGETGARFSILGRASELIRVGGKELLPVDLQLALHDVGAPEFTVLLRGDGPADRVRIKLETAPGRVGYYRDVLHERLGVDAEITPVPVNSLPRSSFKPRRIEK